MIKYLVEYPDNMYMPGNEMDTPTSVAVLFLAMSTADKDIKGEEGFIAERCAEELGISAEDWDRAVSTAMDIYVMDKDGSLESAVAKLTDALPSDTKKEMVEDLYLVAMSDGNYHEKEEDILKGIAERWKVDLPDI